MSPYIVFRQWKLKDLNTKTSIVLKTKPTCLFNVSKKTLFFSQQETTTKTTSPFTFVLDLRARAF